MSTRIDCDDVQTIALPALGPYSDKIRVRWLKGGQIVKELDVERDSWGIKHEPCIACLIYRGDISSMSDNKTIRDKSGAVYTYAQCPTCKGIDAGGCQCGEAPHKVSCPMGFHLYFQLADVDVPVEGESK